jgi:hypothetical protein
LARAAAVNRWYDSIIFLTAGRPPPLFHILHVNKLTKYKAESSQNHAFPFGYRAHITVVGGEVAVRSPCSTVLAEPLLYRTRLFH